MAAAVLFALLGAGLACADALKVLHEHESTVPEEPKMSEPRVVNSNVAAPEPRTFLSIAIDAMHEFHRDHDAFPSAWHQLDISFSASPYYKGDHGTVPTMNDGADWRPKNCTYRYVIESATASSFRIIAVGPHGEVAYEATQSDTEPRRLIPEEPATPPHK